MKFGRDKVPFQSTNTPQLGSTLSTPEFYNFTQIYFLFSHPHSQLLFETNHIFSNSVSRYPQETSRVWLFKSLWPILITILSGTYDEEVAPKLPKGTTKTRGHNKKIFKRGSRLNLRKYFLALRIATIWNELPEELVNAKDVDTFKNALDKHWKYHPSKYDFNHNPYRNIS